ncbi:conserved hypothetical protein [Xenorhabdus cabanillasii JM26]|uniref:Uncharacterized protein n=1 Tax=Xenorhabdus cabanillasii JM26 TaxID=1427517 RepID=W1JA54_9GAMM|nr:conserved hypothetical protein [Xenorhabdus cabanillasii JM26]
MIFIQRNSLDFHKNLAINITTAMIIKFLFVIEFELILQFTNNFASDNFSFIIRPKCSASLISFHQ